MELETPQIYSTFLHIFGFPQTSQSKILFNQLYPTQLQRAAPAIVIIGTHKPLCIYVKNLKRELREISGEHENSEIFFRFITPLKLDRFKSLIGAQAVYRGRQ